MGLRRFCIKQAASLRAGKSSRHIPIIVFVSLALLVVFSLLFTVLPSPILRSVPLATFDSRYITDDENSVVRDNRHAQFHLPFRAFNYNYIQFADDQPLSTTQVNKGVALNQNHTNDKKSAGVVDITHQDSVRFHRNKNNSRRSGSLSTQPNKSNCCKSHASLIRPNRYHHWRKGYPAFKTAARTSGKPTWQVAAASLMTKDKTKVSYIQRLFQAKNSCFRSMPGRANRIMVDKTNKLAYCVVPKAGCTFWINIFRYIKNETGGEVYDSPFHIPRWITHYAEKGKEYSIDNMKTAPSVLKDTFRFMFVRDPYKRLWATWIDKFLLPDYWFGVGQMIAEERSMGKEAVKCPVNITFGDFTKFITKNYFFRYPEDINEHWAPYHNLCDPCLFHPHFIGKMESFEEDSNFVLASANLFIMQGEETNTSKNETMTEELKNSFKHMNNRTYMIASAKLTTTNESTMLLQTRDEHILHEMDMLIEYTFDGVWQSYREIKECVTQDFLAQRLWLAFQYNGYIPEDYPLKPASIGVDDLRQVIIDAYLTWDTNPTSRREAQQRQKRNAMQEAYKSISLDVMKRIQKMFMRDFQQFGYDQEPISLFKRVPTAT